MALSSLEVVAEPAPSLLKARYGRFFNLAECAQFLGVAPSAIKREIKAGRLVAIAPGGELRIAEVDLVAFIERLRAGVVDDASRPNPVEIDREPSTAHMPKRVKKRGLRPITPGKRTP